MKKASLMKGLAPLSMLLKTRSVASRGAWRMMGKRRNRDRLEGLVVLIALPEREGCLVLDSRVGITPSQIAFMMRRREAAGKNQ